MLRVVKGKVSHFQAVGHFCSMTVKDGGSQYIQFFPFFLVVLVAIVVVVADGRIFDGGEKAKISSKKAAQQNQKENEDSNNDRHV